MKKLILILLITVGLQGQTIAVKCERGILYIPVKLNNVLKIDMMLDTGATECSVPPCIANTLIRANTLSLENTLPDKLYILADGSTITCKRFILKSLKIGNRIIYNVECSVSNTDNCPLLLGASALKKLGVIELDYKNKKMTIKNGKISKQK